MGSIYRFAALTAASLMLPFLFWSWDYLELYCNFIWVMIPIRIMIPTIKSDSLLITLYYCNVVFLVGRISFLSDIYPIFRILYLYRNTSLLYCHSTLLLSFQFGFILIFYFGLYTLFVGSLYVVYFFTGYLRAFS